MYNNLTLRLNTHSLIFNDSIFINQTMSYNHESIYFGVQNHGYEGFLTRTDRLHFNTGNFCLAYITKRRKLPTASVSRKELTNRSGYFYRPPFGIFLSICLFGIFLSLFVNYFY